MAVLLNIVKKKTPAGRCCRVSVIPPTAYVACRDATHVRSGIVDAAQPTPWGALRSGPIEAAACRAA